MRDPVEYMYYLSYDLAGDGLEENKQVDIADYGKLSSLGGGENLNMHPMHWEDHVVDYKIIGYYLGTYRGCLIKETLPIYSC